MTAMMEERSATFANREEAAERLADRLCAYRGCEPLVLAVPRGGVPMGRILADALGGDLDVVLVHKIRAPQNPEFAIGAITESGQVTLDPVARQLASEAQILREADQQLEMLKRRRARYSSAASPMDPAGRTVIVVDDGIATGSTMLAAIDAIRRKGPAKLIVAVAVAPRGSLGRLQAHADEIVCLVTPSDSDACSHAEPPAAGFGSVGQFFDDFRQISDDEVVEALRSAAQPLAPSSTTSTSSRHRHVERSAYEQADAMCF